MGIHSAVQELTGGRVHIFIIMAYEDGQRRPNGYSEIGFGMGRTQDTLLPLEKGHKLPCDLRGLEILQSENAIDGYPAFKDK